MFPIAIGVRDMILKEALVAIGATSLGGRSKVVSL
jgi:hypothetical protein